MHLRKTICILCVLTTMCFAVNVPALAANNIFAGTLPKTAEAPQPAPEDEVLLSSVLGNPEKTSRDGYVIETYEADTLDDVLDALKSCCLDNAEKIEIDLKNTALLVYRPDEPARDEAEKETIEKNAGQTVSADASKTAESAVCLSCGGTGYCEFCVGGMCDHCYGFGTVTCNYCYGAGSCRVCYGLGTNSAGKRCSMCYGAGYCKNCYGTGEEDCFFCHGTGACNFCSGSGTCSICHGARLLK